MAKNKNLSSEKQGGNLDFLSKCSFCGSVFGAEDLTILEEEEQKTTLHTACAKCRTASIFFISSSQAGVLTLGMATDLDKDEACVKFLRGAVSADEVIDIHRIKSREDVMRLLK